MELPEEDREDEEVEGRKKHRYVGNRFCRTPVNREVNDHGQSLKEEHQGDDEHIGQKRLRFLDEPRLVIEVIGYTLREEQDYPQEEGELDQKEDDHHDIRLAGEEHVRQDGAIDNIVKCDGVGRDDERQKLDQDGDDVGDEDQERNSRED